MSLLLGRLRHRAEEQLWRTRIGCRWLLRRDLQRIDDHRRSRPEHPFAHVERSETSQNGEDGILAHLFDELGVTHGTFVEIGAADGEQNCTRQLAETGWHGLWVEGDPELAASATRLDLGGRVRVVQAMVGPDDIVGLLSDHDVPARPALLVVDIDSSDYWVVDSVLAAFRPTVLVVEVNGEHPWPWVQPRADAGGAATPGWDRSWNYGASLGAYEALLSRSGYSLLGCDSAGVNAFFVRTDVLTPTMVVAPWRDRYVPPTHRPGTFGHPRRSPSPRELSPPNTPEQLAAVRFPRVELIGPAERMPGDEVLLLLDVRNGSDVTLASAGETPHRMACAVFDVSGERVDRGEPRRSLLAAAVEPGATWPAGVESVLPCEPGRYRLVPTLVQDGVAWRDLDPSEGVEVTVRIGQRSHGSAPGGRGNSVAP